MSLRLFAVLAAHVCCDGSTTMDPRTPATTIDHTTEVIAEPYPGEKYLASRVYGGKLAKTGDFRFVVFLLAMCTYRKRGAATEATSTRTCSGSIISPTWVITAARCIPREYLYSHHNKKQDGRYEINMVAVSVYAGAADINDNTATSMDVVPSLRRGRIIVHDKAVTYTDNDAEKPVWKYDVALLEFVQGFTFSKNIGSVALMSGVAPFMFREKCTALGFGNGTTGKNAKQDREAIGKLKYVLVAAGSTEFCQSLTQIEDWTDDQFLCTQNIDDRRGMVTCSSDRGSPLVCGPAGNKMVVGILSGSKHSLSCGYRAEDNDYTFTGQIEEWVTGETNGHVEFKTSGGGGRGAVTSLVAGAMLGAALR